VIAAEASSASVRLAGALDVTGSFTAVTVTLTLSLSLVAVPLPVAKVPPNSSVTLIVICAEPLYSAFPV
jgi:hypothetical protein